MESSKGIGSRGLIDREGGFPLDISYWQWYLPAWGIILNGYRTEM